MTLSVLYGLFVVLLTKCMDVEKNPGPDENFVTLMQNVDWRFSQIMQGTSTARWMRSSEVWNEL